jgi:hypothetical protein
MHVGCCRTATHAATLACPPAGAIMIECYRAVAPLNAVSAVNGK